MQVNIHESKTNLSKLIKKVSTGQEVIIARAGKPVARLVSFSAQSTKRVPGSAKGKLKISPDFTAALPEAIPSEFENESAS